MIRNCLIQFVLGFCVVSSSFSATLVVDQGGGGDFTNLGAAIQAALANQEADVIDIAPGTYFNVNEAGEVFAIAGEDELTLRGQDADNPPIILIEPNLEETFLPENEIDGLIVQMAGSLRFENLIFLPSEGFALEPDVFDLITIVDHGTADSPSTLDVTFDNVLITHGTLDNEPMTRTGWEDPREGANSTRADAISLNAREPESTDGESGQLTDTINLTLRNTVIAAHGAEVGHSIDYNVPNGTLTLLEGTRLTYPQNITVQNRAYAKTLVQGTEDNPVILYYITGSRALNAWQNENEWEYMWVIGTLPENTDLRFQGSQGAIRLETQAESLSARHCIFANFFMSGIWGIYEFRSLGEIASEGDFSDRTYLFEDCTFFNTPVAHQIGSDEPYDQPARAQIIYRDCIFDTNQIPPAGLLPIPQAALFSDQTAFLDHGGMLVPRDLNTQMTVENLAYNAESVFSARSPNEDVLSSGNLIGDVDFGFQQTEWDPERINDYLVPTNAQALSGQASEGAALDGARTANFATGIDHWQLF